MSQQNVDTARRAGAQLSAGAFDRFAELLNPSVTWVVAKQHPHPRTITGLKALTVYLVEWRDLMGDFRVEFDRYLDIADRVLAIGTVEGMGSGSGVRISAPIAFLYTLRDGLIVAVEEYLDTAEALQAAGLPAAG